MISLHMQSFSSLKNITPLLVIVLATSGCQAKDDKPDQAETAAKVQALVKAAKENLVAVQGGEFLMGDFGEIHSEEKLPYLGNETDNKPLHKVVLSDFSIAKYKVTLDDFTTYTQAQGLPLPYADPKNNPLDKQLSQNPKKGLFPVEVTWYQASSYCQWLGNQIGQPMDLPTEAQWEYAARARGQFLIFATDNGLFEKGRNVASSEDVEKMSGDSFAPIPVGLYPPNALGLYDLGKNGLEWVKDWYAEDYYSRSPVQDPQGPDNGTEKVLRSHQNSKTYPAMTMERNSRKPDGSDDLNDKLRKNLNLPVTTAGYSFRCSAHPITGTPH